MQDAKQVKGKTDQNQVVTAIGNSWIVCKSKSYEGKTYYFNTLTGAAQWNLSDAEVERAKKQTHCLNNRTVQSLQECPEPNEPPMDNLDQRSRQYIYNKKIINNRFSKEPYPIARFVGPQCNYGVPSGAQVGLNLSSQNYNPEVWNVPPTHQILIAPTVVPPFVSQPQIPMTMQYSDRQHISVQNTSVPLNRRFQNNDSNFNNSRHTAPKFYTRGSQFSPRIKLHHGKFQNNFRDKPNDLREILSNRRKQRQSVEDNRDIPNASDTKSISSNEEREPVPGTSFEKKAHINEGKDDSYLSETECNWLEDNVKVKGTKLNLDVTHLRNLAAPDADPDSWYIAADRTILLHHLNFLNMLINSDEDCQLLVPREELAALRKMAGSAEIAARTPRLSNRARRALNFVLQQFDSLCAVQGEELDANSTISHILNCCLNVAEQNYHVILLSNDTELLAQKESTNITMFSMNELKSFLSKSKEHDTKDGSTPIPPESAIRITIPNDFAKDTSINKTCENKAVNPEKLAKKDHERPEINSEVKTTHNSLPATKVTIDTGVQTDFVAPIVEMKRREIKLKRSTSNQTSTHSPNIGQNTNNKQFRWRRKRNLCPATNDASNQTNSSPLNISTNTAEDVELISDKDSSQQWNQLSAECGRYNCYIDDNIEGSDTSSSVCLQKNVNERVIIEETSTSGVISNTTASNHDAESVTNEFPNQLRMKLNYSTAEQDDRLKNNYMFEITTPLIEEYLRMRSDEWISRFVQIMEEVLTQVLQRNKPTGFHLTPPPWTLQEALQCILRSSDYYGDVRDAAKKLSNTLSNISDESDKINIELRPKDFMEMYSFGVYLVDALQGVAKDCEDIQTASDSLVKLLKDIQEPHLDTSYNDPFCEENQDVSLNVTMNTDQPDNSMTVHDTDVNEDENTQYNLRPRKNTPQKQKESTAKNKVKLVRNVDVETNFFTSLNLQKKISQEMSKSSREKEGTSQEFNFEMPCDKKIETNGSNIDNGDKLEVKLVNNKSNVVETRFIRRFSKCLDFDKRLSQREPLDLDQLDYDDNCECIEDEYYDKVEGEFQDEELRNNTQDNNEYIKELYPTQSQNISGDNVVSGIIQTFINDIKSTFTQVQEFCKNSHQQLRENGHLLTRRKAIHYKADKARLRVEDIIKSLNSMVCRESYPHENGMHFLLKAAEIEGFDLNNNLFSHYRTNIVKCLDQANILLEVVGIIINATKT